LVDFAGHLDTFCLFSLEVCAVIQLMEQQFSEIKDQHAGITVIAILAF